MKPVRVFIGFALLCALAAGAAAWFLAQPYAGFSGEKFVDIPKGTGTRAVARQLAGAGVVRSSWEFLLVRALRPKATLQAGEYVFRKPASSWEVFDRIARGDIFFYQVTVPEGNNMFDIAAELEGQGIMKASAFLEAARDPALIRDLDPNAPSLEGYLFPDTYRISRHTTPRQLCQRMTARFRKEWTALSAGAAGVHDTVTLASLIEKEAKKPEERPVIASVFLNRLRVSMPLQCDPTTIYAALLDDRFRGTIFRSDLESKQRYNTYQHGGLPPGPIANPGVASLSAALRPADTAFFYFVALPDGSGAHRFSKELAAHERAVRDYRRGLHQTNQAHPARTVPGGAASGGDRRSGMGRTAGEAGSGL